jgi:pseudouridine-5'-phosphate glycosidase
MTTDLLIFSKEVDQARRLKLPIVALESAVITHGLPHPINLELAVELENIVRDEQAVPATIALIDGKIHVGLTMIELENVAHAKNPRKISRRDFGVALAGSETGGTTVAGTLHAAHEAGIKVFATGGIGGVHRGTTYDISADLVGLSQTPVLVVCAGGKSILDLPATLEVLETHGVPIIGYRTSEFPAFYSRSSGLPVTVRCQSVEEISDIAQAHWGAGLNGAVLVVNPPPAKLALKSHVIEKIIQEAVKDAQREGIAGAALTPYLLDRVNSLTGGASLKANLALLRNNARLAARIAKAMVKPIQLISI